MENYFEKYKEHYLNFLFRVECFKDGKNPEDIIKALNHADTEDKEKKPLEQERLEQLERERIIREQEEAEKLSTNEAGSDKSKYDLEFPDGYYMGETLNGQMHGKGIKYWYNGKKWEGTWENGKANGHIIVTFDGEQVYDGNMLEIGRASCRERV